MLCPLLCEPGRLQKGTGKSSATSQVTKNVFGNLDHARESAGVADLHRLAEAAERPVGAPENAFHPRIGDSDDLTNIVGQPELEQAYQQLVGLSRDAARTHRRTAR